jgi:hypothetical protein
MTKWFSPSPRTKTVIEPRISGFVWVRTDPLMVLICGYRPQLSSLKGVSCFQNKQFAVFYFSKTTRHAFELSFSQKALKPSICGDVLFHDVCCCNYHMGTATREPFDSSQVLVL